MLSRHFINIARARAKAQEEIALFQIQDTEIEDIKAK